MSKLSHANRREHQKRAKKSASLNLVSLMDIFTILVFFLMVNSSEVEVLQNNAKIKLPDSTSEQQPDNRIVITVTADELVVQGRAVANLEGLHNSAATTIAGLEKELQYQAARKGGEVPEGGFEVTVLGDRNVPYWLLKKIMMTCQVTDFAKVSLAVNKVEDAAS